MASILDTIKARVTRSAKIARLVPIEADDLRRMRTAMDVARYQYGPRDSHRQELTELVIRAEQLLARLES